MRHRPVTKEQIKSLLFSDWEETGVTGNSTEKESIGTFGSFVHLVVLTHFVAGQQDSQKSFPP